LTIVDGGEHTVTVVGVVADSRVFPDSRMHSQVYFPAAQRHPRNVTFIAATAGPPGLISKDLQRAIWSVAPRLPVSETTDLETTAMVAVRHPRFFAWAVGAFAAAALLLTGLAVYGLLAFAVAQGRREIGIRLAMGATPLRVGRAVLARAAGLGAAGVVIGAVAARGLSRYLESLLSEVSATDAKVFALAAVVVLVIALVAAIVPAARAVRVDPATSLRA
jgi:protein-S-isoprenylcysteine O-methyltransferase Ste14